MNPQKERERIKWEYLKRSDFYREFCECHKRPGEAIPDKFQPVQGPINRLNPVVITYIKYKDIHSKSFDDWYFEYYGANEYQGSSLAGVDDLTDGKRKDHYLYRLSFYIIDRFKKGSSNREPTPLEMMDCLWITMREESGTSSYLKVKQSDFTTEEARSLADDVYKILMKRVPKDRLRKAELEKYLVVYDMRKAGRSDDDIIKNIYEVQDVDEVEGKRSKDAKTKKELIDEINKYYKYSIRLIDNAVKDIYSDLNIFPGEYGKK